MVIFQPGLGCNFAGENPPEKPITPGSKEDFLVTPEMPAVGRGYDVILPGREPGHPGPVYSASGTPRKVYPQTKRKGLSSKHHCCGELLSF